MINLPKAIFWDNDGVLVDTEALYYEANRAALASVGITLSRDDYITWMLVDGRGVFHLVEGEGGSPDDITALKAVRDRVFHEMITTQPIRPIAGVADTLAQLHRWIPMGIVTSSERHQFEMVHASSELLGYFDFVLAAGDFPRSKPHPDPYLTALHRVSLRPSECLVVEDSIRGLTAARRAGIPCVIVPSEFTRGCSFEGAAMVLDSVEELARALRRMKDEG